VFNLQRKEKSLSELRLVLPQYRVYVDLWVERSSHLVRWRLSTQEGSSRARIVEEHLALPDHALEKQEELLYDVRGWLTEEIRARLGVAASRLHEPDGAGRTIG
jgi:hypothetical protein